MSTTIKMEFGRQVRTARNAKRISRAALAMRLGVSPKTIQSWEMGRTFPERLDLLPAIREELGIDFAQPLNDNAGERGAQRAGPLPLTFQIAFAEGESPPALDLLAQQWVAVPFMKPRAVSKSVSELMHRDVGDYAIVPASWAPRSGILVATRMADSAMTPQIPLGAAVVIDRRFTQPDKVCGQVVALDIAGKGLRIRRFIRGRSAARYIGAAAAEVGRGRIDFREERGDHVVGRVVGVLTQID